MSPTCRAKLPVQAVPANSFNFTCNTIGASPETGAHFFVMPYLRGEGMIRFRKPLSAFGSEAVLYILLARGVYHPLRPSIARECIFPEMGMIFWLSVNFYGERRFSTG